MRLQNYRLGKIVYAIKVLIMQLYALSSSYKDKIQLRRVANTKYECLYTCIFSFFFFFVLLTRINTTNILNQISILSCMNWLVLFNEA